MKRFLSIAILVVIIGCKEQRKPVKIVELVDISGSIDGSDSRMNKAAEMVSDKLVGGDELTIFPICNSAFSTKGQPYHFVVSTKREAFDQQIARFKSGVHASLAMMAEGESCQKTAILDTLDRAMSEPGDIYILTDGIEDSSLNFYTDPRLATRRGSEKLATELARGHAKTGAKMRLGLVETHDFDVLPPARQYAIVAFWKSYLSALSADVMVESPELLRD